LTPSEVKPDQYEDLAGLIEYSLVRPEFSEEDIARHCGIAREYRVAAVIVRGSDVDQVSRWLSGSGIRLCAAANSPHGFAPTAVKCYEVRELLRRGAQAIDTVMNTGKLISRQFQYLEMELQQMADACRQSSATLTVNLESEYLTEEHKIVACRIARRAGAEFIGTNKFEDIALLLAHSRDRLKIKTNAPIADLQTAQSFRAANCSRIELPDPVPILDAWKSSLESRNATNITEPQA